MALYVPYTLVVDRPEHVLEVWYRGRERRMPRLAETHRVAVGTVGHETPAGVYCIIHKTRNPTWHVPDAQWAKDAGLVPGTDIPGGDPNNPLVGAFLQITEDPTGNVGIHGTRNLASLGTDASHGCIRVDPEVAISLHRRIPTGTPVHII